MRRLCAALVPLLLVLAAGPAHAHGRAVSGRVPADLLQDRRYAAELEFLGTGLGSDNVTWLKRLDLGASSFGARLLGQRMYVTTSAELIIFDISVAQDPQILSRMQLPQKGFPEEDPDTDGRVLIMSSGGALHVVDVRDAAQPKLLSVLGGVDEHTMSCVLRCTWAYGSEGAIVDLRDPRAPRLAGDWRRFVPDSAVETHDVTEVAPGRVLTSTTTMALLDVRRDPTNPSLVATARTADRRFIHGNLWPRAGRDRWMLAGGETFEAECTEPSAAALMTWDTASVASTKKFRLVDSWRPTSRDPREGGGGIPVLGSTACGHWFSERPGWRNGGQLAIGWYEYGVRFLDVSPSGRIREVGWYVPQPLPFTSSAYWASREVVYVFDLDGRVDVLRVLLPTSKPTRSGRVLEH